MRLDRPVKYLLLLYMVVAKKAFNLFSMHLLQVRFSFCIRTNIFLITLTIIIVRMYKVSSLILSRYRSFQEDQSCMEYLKEDFA